MSRATLALALLFAAGGLTMLILPSRFGLQQSLGGVLLGTGVGLASDALLQAGDKIELARRHNSLLDDFAQLKEGATYPIIRAATELGVAVVDYMAEPTQDGYSTVCRVARALEMDPPIPITAVDHPARDEFYDAVTLSMRDRHGAPVIDAYQLGHLLSCACQIKANDPELQARAADRLTHLLAGVRVPQLWRTYLERVLVAWPTVDPYQAQALFTLLVVCLQNIGLEASILASWEARMRSFIDSADIPDLLFA